MESGNRPVTKGNEVNHPNRLAARWRVAFHTLNLPAFGRRPLPVDWKKIRIVCPLAGWRLLLRGAGANPPR